VSIIWSAGMRRARRGCLAGARAGRRAESARPPALARRAAASLRGRMAAAVRGRIPVGVGVPAGILVIAVAVVLWQHRRAS